MPKAKWTPEQKKRAIEIANESTAVDAEAQTGVPAATIRSWLSRSRNGSVAMQQEETLQRCNADENIATRDEEPVERGVSPPNDDGSDRRKASATQTSPDSTKQTNRHRGGQQGNSNAVGHGPPRGNSNAVTHGFFRKHLPARLQAIHEQVCEMDIVEMAWLSLTTTFTVIMDSLQSLYVDDPSCHMTLVKKKKWFIPQDEEGAEQSAGREEGEGDMNFLSEIEFEHHRANDDQVKALAALNRQQALLQSQIKTFLAIADESDLRRLQLEKMQADINATRSRVEIDRERLEIEKAKANGGGGDDAKAKAWSDAVRRMEERKKQREQQKDSGEKT